MQLLIVAQDSRLKASRGTPLMAADAGRPSLHGAENQGTSRLAAQAGTVSRATSKL
jgi:hypothetical protein